MAIKTPSKGVNQNGDKPFVDKYWGRVPMYLHRIPETINDGDGYVVKCNPDFIDLLEMFMEGTINKDNLGTELWVEIKMIVDLIPFYGVVPMPDYDALFDCWIESPSPTIGCPLFFSKDPTYGCAVFYTADGSPLIVEP